VSSAENPFDGLLGDLLKILGGQGTDAWIDSARTLAVGVASGGEAEENPDPLERIALEQLADIVGRHVIEVTGRAAVAQVAIAPVNRSSWALSQLEAWRPSIEQVVAGQAEAAGASLLKLGEVGEGAAIFSQFAEMLGPMMLGMQFGSAAGHLAERALGSYALPLPWPASADLLVVPRNLAAFAQDWSLPVDEVRIFVLAHELAAHSVLGAPATASRMAELLSASMADALAAQRQLLEKMTSSGDPEVLASLMGDPEALLAELVTPGGQAASANLTAAATAVGAYVDHVADLVCSRLCGSAALLREAWRRHRVTDAKGEQAAGGLFGVDLGAGEVERGQAFVAGVLERSGDAGLTKLLRDGWALPTPAELDEPGLWLERLDFGELELPEGEDGAAPT
jgi:putative hydrolase